MNLIVFSSHKGTHTLQLGIDLFELIPLFHSANIHLGVFK
jgi:hypothetical protein